MYGDQCGEFVCGSWGLRVKRSWFLVTFHLSGTHQG